MSDIPKYKIEEAEKVQAQVEDYFAKKKKIKKVKQGQQKEHLSTSFSCSNAARKKLIKGNETGKT